MVVLSLSGFSGQMVITECAISLPIQLNAALYDTDPGPAVFRKKKKGGVWGTIKRMFATPTIAKEGKAPREPVSHPLPVKI